MGLIIVKSPPQKTRPNPMKAKIFAFTGENDVSYGNLKLEFNVYNIFNKINVLAVHADTGSWWARSDAYYEDDSANSNFAEVNANPARIGERRHYRFGISYAW